MAGKMKLDIDARNAVLQEFTGGKKVEAIAKKHRVSVRTVYNVMDLMGAHRCRCGDTHERKSA